MLIFGHMDPTPTPQKQQKQVTSDTIYILYEHFRSLLQL